MSMIAAIGLGIALLGGGGVGLVPGEAATPAPTPGQSGSDPLPAPVPDPALPGAVGIGALAVALAALQRRTGGALSPAAGLGLAETDPLFVFVPGHGQPDGARAFDALVDLMDVEPESVRFFDYRWVDGGADARSASRDVRIDDAAAALNAYLAGLVDEGREVYLVGFSKGGATVAELVADWDDGEWGPAPSVIGAALLDPPIAAGTLGRLQSLGRHVGPIPDDGGYEPVQCRFLDFDCSDRRIGLGEASGVDVIVVRNPRAAITSFGDVPEGLRVYDAADGGPGPIGQMLRNPFALPGRIAEAHEAVLADPRVADCIVAEARRAGTCGLPRRRADPPLPGLGGGATRAPTGQKVV